jgi:phosphonatase-like hydrolase
MTPYFRPSKLNSMDIQKIKLIVFDMSGTTIEDKNEVLDCFHEALRQTGLDRDKADINTMMGWSKIEVFRRFWTEELGKRAEFLEFKAQESFGVFRQLLENYYAQNVMLPTEGCLETFAFLREKGVKIALNTGFYRKVVDVLLTKMDWKIGRDIDFVIASDEVPRGRPESFMIKAAMRRFGIRDAQEVIKIGDTPVDLAEGRNAGCLTFGLTNGSHTAEELQDLDSDGLYTTLSAFLEDLKKGTIITTAENRKTMELVESI